MPERSNSGPGPDFAFVRSVLRVEETDSTNDLAKRLLTERPLELPMLIWADRQTRGRGQGLNAWWSDAGSLTASVILDPAAVGLSPLEEPRVALAVATAAVMAIRTSYRECRAGLRWPNDVEVGGRKLGGILPEKVVIPSGPRLVIGIGLNVRTRMEEASPEVRRMAATLAEWGRQGLPDEPIAAILRQLLDRLPHHLEALASRRDESSRAWNQFDTLAGTTVRVEVGSRIIEGVADGIDESGGLAIVHEGRREILHAGRVLRD